MKVSIVVPMYNVSKYIVRCLESLINQTYKNIEIIAINDGSTDNTLLVATEYAKKDSRIKLYDQNNKGLSEARNAGIAKSTGEYIFFVDSDDWLEDETIERLINFSNTYNLDISACGISQYTSNGVINKVVEEEIILEGEEAAVAYYNSKFKMEPMVWNKLYKRYLFDNLMFEKNKLHEDKYFTPKVLFNSNFVGLISYLGYNYEMEREGSITNKKMNSRNLDGLNANLNNSIYFKEKNNLKLARMSRRKFYLDLMLYYCLYERSGVTELSNELYKKFKKNFAKILWLSLLYDNPQRLVKTLLFRISPTIYYEKWSKSKA